MASSTALYSKQPLRWLLRNFQIAVPVGSWLLNVAIDKALSREPSLRKARATQLTDAISGLGPAIIKAGQALSSRPDLLPKEYLTSLQSLQDSVPTFPDSVAFATVESELGRPFESMFSLIDTKPVAAASIGQVYKATLLSTNTTVALKIQRPALQATVSLDLYVLRWWSGFWNVFARAFDKDVDLQGVIDDFGRLIYSEMDYVAEADVSGGPFFLLRISLFLSLFLSLSLSLLKILKILKPSLLSPSVNPGTFSFPSIIPLIIPLLFSSFQNAERFGESYADILDIISVPKIYRSYTTSKVLVMEWIDGVRLTDSSALSNLNLSKKKLVEALVQSSLRQILENGFFHADPHGGNLLAVTDGRLCYLDFGMMGYCTQEQRTGFLLAVVLMVDRDWPGLVLLFQRLGFIPSGIDTTPILRALEGAMPDVLNADVDELNFKNVVSKLGDIT